MKKKFISILLLLILILFGCIIVNVPPIENAFDNLALDYTIEYTVESTAEEYAVYVEDTNDSEENIFI